MSQAARPRFSIVSAVYEVAPYLPEFIASIEAQALDQGRIEVIAVDDGSTDGSLGLLQAWRDQGRVAITVVSQPNAGQGAARNAGLDLAHGEWVTFTDPDDVLEPGYLAAADAFARDHPDVDVMSGKRLQLDEALGVVRDVHPRRWQFADGSRVADLAVEPNVFPVSASTAFFRTDRLRETGIRYDPELRPHFEDQHFAARFLLALDRPLVGLVADAAYRYRVRLANDSTLQRLHADPRSYTTVFERGYLDLARRGREATGHVPAWIQQLILYELTRRYLREADAPTSRLVVPDALAPRFHELFGELARSLDPEQVYGHTASRLEGIWAELLVHGYRDERWVPSTADRTDVDRAMRLQRVSYRYRGEPPAERVTLGGADLEPPFAKVRDVTYFGRTALRERILWVPASPDLRLWLDGASVPIGAPRAPVRAIDARRAAATPPSGARAIRERLRPHTVALSLTRLLARTVFRRGYRRAWVLMDGVHGAGGEGERLFAWLRRERPDVNAWFVLEAGSPDWGRIREAGAGRLVAHGSLRWKALLLNAAWLLASDPGDDVTRPPAIRQLIARAPWRFGLLQRAPIDGDVSPWADRLSIDLFTVTTDEELAAVAGDGTRSRLTRKEVRRTGRPTDDDGAAARIFAAVDELGRPWTPAPGQPSSGPAAP